MQVVYILWLRQLKRFFRSKARIVGSIGQPLLFLAALGFGIGPIFAKAGEGDYLSFLVPGVIAMTVLFSSIFTGIDIIWDRQFGFLKETLVAPVSRFKIVLGRTLGGATTACLQGLIVFIITAPFIQHLRWSWLPLGFIFMFLIAFFFTAIGTCIGSVLEDMQAFQLIMNFLVMPIFFLSGALFPTGDLSTFLQKLYQIDPLSYGVDGLRGCFTGTFTFGLQFDLFILLALGLLAMYIGSYFFTKIEV